MNFGLLGPLVVRRGGLVVPVPRGKQRALLAALLLAANQVLPLHKLVEILWEPGPPPSSAEVTARNYVRRLRQVLGEAGRARISTHPRGYMLAVAPDELDVSRFEILLLAARAAARQGSWEAAESKAREALSLWRGQPLADVESDELAVREVPRLLELRPQAEEIRFDAALHLGHQADVVADLERLAAAYPLREHLHCQLMLALHRVGRGAEALAVFQSARRHLIEELGTEPGTELREVHQRILAGDAALSVPAPRPVGDTGRVHVVPQELPAAVTYFVGRSGELAGLSGLLEHSIAETPGTVVISAIGGTAGVGKTALAVHWAHRVAERFPDGQLYVNLRGYGPYQPMSAADALAGFLHSLGVSGPNIPAQMEERAVRYRSLLAGRRMLIVLDNAREAEQVRPLLPGTAGCAAVVTSRDSLAGLVARDGAFRVELDLLPIAEATGLLRALIGERATADPRATEVLAVVCSRLPLALRVVAEMAVARPDIPLAALVAELNGAQLRLGLLDAGGDQNTSVRAVFSWSYQHLDADTARGFRLVGLHPGQDFDRYAIAALAGTTAEHADHILLVLTRAHLLQISGSGRYGMHDLLRSYTRELTAHDGGAEAHGAFSRLADYYVHTAAIAMDSLYPAERHRRPPIARSASPGPRMGATAVARAWLDIERANLVAVAAHATECSTDHAVRLSTTLIRYLEAGAHHPEAIAIHGHAGRAAWLTGDNAGEAAALVSLGGVAWSQGRSGSAARFYHEALGLLGESADRFVKARAVGNLGVVELEGGSYQEAEAHLQQALELFREVGDPPGEARTLVNLGLIYLQQHQYRKAVARFQQALALCRDVGDTLGEAEALGSLGVVDFRQGHHARASAYQRQALALFREVGHRKGEVDTLIQLGLTAFQEVGYHQACDYLQGALLMSRETGHLATEVAALNRLGEVLLATAQPGRARDEHAAALVLARQIASTEEQARAYRGIGNAHRDIGDIDQARQHWQQALGLYLELGAPEAEQIRAQLRRVGDRNQREPC